MHIEKTQNVELDIWESDNTLREYPVVWVRTVTRESGIKIRTYHARRSGAERVIDSFTTKLNAYSRGFDSDGCRVEVDSEIVHTGE